jgi:hypothetical protein
MFGDPLGGSFFGSEALDYFRLIIGPKNVYHPAESGVAFPRHESGPMLGHLPNMRLPRLSSSRAHFQTDLAYAFSLF